MQIIDVMNQPSEVEESSPECERNLQGKANPLEKTWRGKKKLIR